MAMTRRLWSISAAAIELGRDRRTIASALRDVPPDGQIDPRTGGWWLETILRALQPGGAEGRLDRLTELARKAKEEADRLEMQNALTRGELLRREDVDAAVCASFTRVRARLLAIPSKLAPQVVGLRTAAEAQATLRAAIHEALRELSETTVDDLMEQDTRGGMETLEARGLVTGRGSVLS